MNDKLTAHIGIRIEPWLKKEIDSWPRFKRLSVMEAIRKLLEHEARQTSPKPAP